MSDTCTSTRASKSFGFLTLVVAFGLSAPIAGVAQIAPGAPSSGAPLPSAPTVRAPESVGAEPLRGRLQLDNVNPRIEAERLVLPSAATGLRVEMVLPQALLQELRLPTQTTFRTLAVQRPTPGGLLAAARFDDQRGLYAIVETIRDLPLLSPQEREGIRVEQQAAPSERVLVYEDACTIVSDVPTLFAGANERLVLRAGQSGELRIGNIPFRVALVSSRFVSPKPCNQPLEGGQVRVDYVLTRAN